MDLIGVQQSVADLLLTEVGLDRLLSAETEQREQVSHQFRGIVWDDRERVASLVLEARVTQRDRKMACLLVGILAREGVVHRQLRHVRVLAAPVAHAEPTRTPLSLKVERAFQPRFIKRCIKRPARG